MKSFYNQENIEAYLTNRLNGDEARMFVEGLSKDPLLQNEISLQKDIIEALKESRRLELKSRLKNITVAPEPLNTLNWKKTVSAIAVVGGLIGALFYFNNDIAVNKEIISVPAKQETPVPIAQTAPSLSAGNLDKPFSNSSPAKTTDAFGPSEIKVGQEKAASISKQIDTEFKSPLIKEDFGDTDVIVESNIDIPTGDVIMHSENLRSKVEVVIEPKRKDAFQYQFYSNKLYLYCDFQSQPYELLELNSKKSKQLYLRFDSFYYELKPNQVKMAELTPIRNQELIKQLESVKYK